MSEKVDFTTFVESAFFYIINYLNNLDSYGTPYLAPYSPRIPRDLKDAILASSIVQNKRRPKSRNSAPKTRPNQKLFKEKIKVIVRFITLVFF